MNSITEQNKKAYDYLSDFYAHERSNNPDLDLANAFISYLSPKARILDVGCGPGHYSLFFSKHGFDVVGIDVSKNMISLAKELCVNIDFSVQDMHDIFFDACVFDALWVCSSFIHVQAEDASSVLSEFKRVMKDAGVLFVNAIIGDLKYRIESEAEIGGSYKGKGRYFQWYKDSESFAELLKNSGFSVKEISRKEIVSQVAGVTNQWVNYICIKE